MDIWKWVVDLERDLYNQGHVNIARMLYDLPSYAVHGQYQKFETYYPEILAFAREHNHTWLEVFLRHWNLQCHVLNRHQARKYLRECISLLEFSHRDENRNCPQSICTVQDLCICYGKVDGTGYAQARIDVLHETIDRIDPSWPCFACLTGELTFALYDSEQKQQAYDMLQEHIIKAKEMGNHIERSVSTLTAVLYAGYGIGRYDETLSYANSIQPELPHQQRTKQLIVTLCYLAKQDYAAAQQNFPIFQDIQEYPPVYQLWAITIEKMVEKNLLENTQALGLELKKLVKTSLDNGCLRDTIDIAVIFAHLAIQRKAYTHASLIIPDIEQAIEELEQKLDAPEKLNEIKTLLSQTPSDTIQSDIAEMQLEYLFANPEANTVALAEIYIALQEIEKAQVLLNQYKDISNIQWVKAYTQLLFNIGNVAEYEVILQQALPTLKAEDKLIFLKQLFLIYQKQDKLQDIIKTLEAILNIDPQEHVMRQHLIHTLRNHQNFEQALLHSQYLMEHTDNYLEYLTDAIILKNEQVIETIKNKYNLPIDNHGYFNNTDYKAITLALREEKLYGVLVGPVIAKVMDLAPVQQEQYYAREYFCRNTEQEIIPIAAAYSPPLYCSTFSIRGFKPNPEQSIQIEKLFNTFHAVFVEIPQEEEQPDEIYNAKTDSYENYWEIVVAIPLDMDIHEFIQKLQAINTRFNWVWPELWSMLGEEEKAEQHWEREEEWW